jgi:hypothetical protein
MEKHEHHFLRLAGKILLTTVLVSLAIFLAGYLLHWNQPAQYSNGFFIAGAIVIVLGVFSIAGGIAQRTNFEILYAETAGQAGIAERNQRTVSEITQRYGNMVFLMVTGLLLILIAVLIGQLFIPA